VPSPTDDPQNPRKPNTKRADAIVSMHNDRETFLIVKNKDDYDDVVSTIFGTLLGQQQPLRYTT
jgi:hypothetical protein